jgi:hypothetical protein
LRWQHESIQILRKLPQFLFAIQRKQQTSIATTRITI